MASKITTKEKQVGVSVLFFADEAEQLQISNEDMD